MVPNATSSITLTNMTATALDVATTPLDVATTPLDAATTPLDAATTLGAATTPLDAATTTLDAATTLGAATTPLDAATTTLDAGMYPHILAAIIDVADRRALMLLRSVPKEVLRKVNRRRWDNRQLIWYNDAFHVPVLDSQEEVWEPHPDFPHGFDPVIEHVDRQNTALYQELVQVSTGPVAFRTGLSATEAREYHDRLQDALASTTVLDLRGYPPEHAEVFGTLWLYGSTEPYEIDVYITSPIPVIRVWTVDEDDFSERNFRYLHLHVQVETLVFNALGSMELPSGSRFQTSLAGRQPVNVRPQGSPQRVVIHVTPFMPEVMFPLGVHPNFIKQNTPHEVIYVFQSIVVEENWTIRLLLSSVLIPCDWWYNHWRSYQYEFTTREAPGLVERVTIVNGTVEIPMATLIELSEWFGLSLSPQIFTIIDFVRAVGDNWYGRERLEQRVRFLSLEEYAAELGPARFNLEMGYLIDGAP